MLRRTPQQTKQSLPNYPVFTCIACTDEVYRNHQGRIEKGTIVNVAFWPDGNCTLRTETYLSDTSLRVTRSRPPLGARIVYKGNDMYAYVTLQRDIAEAAYKYLTDYTITAICAPPKTFFDTLLPVEDQLGAFHSFVNDLYVRACEAGLVKVDDVESEYNKLQKVANLATGAGTAGERQAALIAARNILQKLARRAL